MTPLRVASLAVALALIAAPAPARAEVDLIDQQLVVDLVQKPGEMTIEVTAKIALSAGDSALLVLNPAIPFASLAYNGTPVTASDKGQYSVIALPETPAGPVEGTLTAVLQGKPDCSYQGSYDICRCSADGAFLLTSTGVGTWFLYNVAAVDPFTGSLALRIPAEHRAVALGATPTIDDHGDGSATWTFAFDWPVAEMSFATGVYEELHAAPGGFPVRGLYPAGAGHRELMQGVVDEASRMAAVLGKLWGELPMAELQYATVSGRTPFAGTSGQGLILLSDMVYQPMAAYLVPQVNHELGHVWWGTLASGGTEYGRGFFTESLAEYSLWRALGVIDGEARRTAGTRMNAVWYMYRRPPQEAAVLAPLGTEAAIFAIYHKGSTVVRTLEEAAGAAALDAGLRAMIEAGPFGATVEGFLKAVQDAGGGDLSPYVSGWLEGTGFPKVQISAAIEPTAQGLRLSLSARGDTFPMRVPVVVRLADGTAVDATLDYANGEGSVDVELSAPPALVELDPRWTAVRELSPALAGDVSLDGAVDGADLIEVALRLGAYLPTTRREDGSYDPLYDLDGSREIDDADLGALVQLAAQ